MDGDSINTGAKANDCPDVGVSRWNWSHAPSAGSIWTAPNAIDHICKSSGPGGKCTGDDWKENVDLTPANVLNDIANCNLRSVSWVIPTGANSDHPRGNDGGGPSWVASIVNAIGNSTADTLSWMASFQLALYAVENMPAQPMARREVWMVEIIGSVMVHADPLHHTAGAKVCSNREGNNA